LPLPFALCPLPLCPFALRCPLPSALCPSLPFALFTVPQNA
jgi:hypothetical protein